MKRTYFLKYEQKQNLDYIQVKILLFIYLLIIISCILVIYRSALVRACLMVPKEIVVVGGGAAGLELIARLINDSKSYPSINITLIDNQLKHIWKPLFHEIAAGSFEDLKSTTDYISYATKKGFCFQLGQIKKLDRKTKTLTIAAYLDQQNKELLPERHIKYDILVLAIGSQVNDFNTKGVKEHGFMIDNLTEAEFLNVQLINQIIKMKSFSPSKPVTITIVGGGATGVELAAEFNYALTKTLRRNNSEKLFQIILIEASDRLLSALPARVSSAVYNYLTKNGIQVRVDTKIIEVTADSVITSQGDAIASTLTVWVAGVKANSILTDLDGLEVNNINQLIVNNKLQTTRDETIFAIGDCACCFQTDKKGNIFTVPARAQAAYQQAKTLALSLRHLLNHQPLVIFKYYDYGSLISLSNGTVGNLMSRIAKSIYLEGWLARLFYWLLYRKHLFVLHGAPYITIKILRDFIAYIHPPEIKLH